MQQADNGDTPKTNVIAEMSRPGQTGSLPDLIEFASNIEKERGFGEERIEEIRSALREALANIINYSYERKNGDITVTCKEDHWGKFMIVIADSGDPSNILLADVVFSEDEGPVDQKKKGSAKLIKKLVENIEYKRVDQQNVLSFTVSPHPRSV